MLIDFIITKIQKQLNLIKENILQVESDLGDLQSDKADKIVPSNPLNVALLDATGNLADSGNPGAHLHNHLNKPAIDTLEITEEVIVSEQNKDITFSTTFDDSSSNWDSGTNTLTIVHDFNILSFDTITVGPENSPPYLADPGDVVYVDPDTVEISIPGYINGETWSVTLFKNNPPSQFSYTQISGLTYRDPSNDLKPIPTIENVQIFLQSDIVSLKNKTSYNFLFPTGYVFYIEEAGLALIEINETIETPPGITFTDSVSSEIFLDDPSPAVFDNTNTLQRVVHFLTTSDVGKTGFDTSNIQLSATISQRAHMASEQDYTDTFDATDLDVDNKLLVIHSLDDLDPIEIRIENEANVEVSLPESAFDILDSNQLTVDLTTVLTDLGSHTWTVKVFSDPDSICRGRFFVKGVLFKK